MGPIIAFTAIVTGIIAAIAALYIVFVNRERARHRDEEEHRAGRD